VSAAGPRRVQSEASREALFEEEALGKAYDARLLGRLWPYIAPYRYQVAATIFFVFPLLVLDLAPALVVKVGLDDHLVPAVAEASEPGSAGPLGGSRRWLSDLLAPPEGVGPLLWLAVIYFVLTALSAALQYVDVWIMSRTGQSAMRDLRRVVFEHIQRLHLGYFDKMPVGRLVTRATNDVENVAEMFSAGIVALVRDVLKMVGIAAALFAMNARLAAIAFIIVPILAVAAVVFRFKVRQAFRVVRVRIARINAYLQENVTGMKVIQLFTRERRNFRDFDAMNADHRDAWLQSIRYDSALFAVVELASNLTIAVVIWQSAGLAGLGLVYIFFDWMRRFFMPLRDLSAKYSVMQSSMASCERIFQLLDAEPAVRDAEGVVAPTGATRGAVVFENVWFAYDPRPGAAPGDPETDWVLRDVSFDVAPGERVAFVGATGAGKTTVIKLLTRLYDVTHGRILIDGTPLQAWPQESLRRRIAMVLQDVFLFSGTIADNIALDREDVSRADVEQVGRAVHAHRFVETLPRGYETPVRERGANFSAGQRQLLSFARALAHGADILVLDEATSSIDTETEALVQQGIHTLMEEKTALVIAHRLSTIEDVDRIYVLHKGRLVESGRHEELLAAEGVYHTLYRLQYAAQKQGPAVAAG
jgi:ABC-type multidrug transport system fused ATPase/permease subunit